MIRICPLLIFLSLTFPTIGLSQGFPQNVQVNDLAGYGHHLPSIALGPKDEIYVVWVDCRNDPTCTNRTDIYFSKSTDGGVTFERPSIRVNEDRPAFRNAPKIATDRSGCIYVVWHDNSRGADLWDVYLSKSTDGGASFSASIALNEQIPDVVQYEPALALDASGNIYVSWNRLYYDEGLEAWDYDVYMAKSTDGGETFSPAIKVNDGPDLQYKSSIKVGPRSGSVYITWTDRRNSSISDIYFAKSTDGGTSFSPNIRVNTYSSQSQGYPEIAIDEDETIYIVWNDSRHLYAKNSRDIYMARSTDFGKSFEPELKINDHKISPEFEYLYPSITAFGHGHVAIVWEDRRKGKWDIYLTRSDNRGESFKPSRRVNDVLKGNQSVAAIVMDPRGDVHCVWRDQRNGNFDIYYAPPLRSMVGLVSPIGGEAIPSGTEYDRIEWALLDPEEGARIDHYDLQYSVDQGDTWKVIVEGLPNTTYSHAWAVPTFTKNKNRCLVKVVARDFAGRRIAADQSISPFTIFSVLNVQHPNGRHIFFSGNQVTILWETQDKVPATAVELYYTKDGGTTWLLIEALDANPRSYVWTVPSVNKVKEHCKVKVVLKAGEIELGSDVSNGYFTIRPP